MFSHFILVSFTPFQSKGLFNALNKNVYYGGPHYRRLEVLRVQTCLKGMFRSVSSWDRSLPSFALHIVDLDLGVYSHCYLDIPNASYPLLALKLNEDNLSAHAKLFSNVT